MRIVIAEDAAIMRDGLAAILTRRGHDVLAAVGDPEALIKAVGEHRPDAAVVDVRMPPTHTDEGLRAAAAIRRRFPVAGVLVFSQYIEAHAAAELLFALLAQGRSNAAIASDLFISPKVVEKHVASIFDKLGLAPSDSDNRRVLAAIRYLES
jgi:DNA-binding NarL/FixJ family response regulator